MSRIRVNRVGERIKKEISQIIYKEIKDPRIGFLTVTSVEMSGDLQLAKVFVSVLGDPEEIQQTLAALEKAKGFIRSQIGQRIQMRYTPELTFTIDTSLEHSEYINQLLKEVKPQGPKE